LIKVIIYQFSKLYFNHGKGSYLNQEATKLVLFFTKQKSVYRNGDILTPPIKILLYRHTLQSYDAVLNDVTEKVQLLNGAVLK
jgi:hypothetical protein